MCSPEPRPAAGMLAFCVLAWCLSGCESLEDRVPIVEEPRCAPDRGVEIACTVDGDTIDATDCGDDVGERVRLLGVAAPEIEHGADPAECYGDEAALFLDSLVTGREAELSFDTECADAFDRTLAWVSVQGSEGDPLIDVIDDLDLESEVSIDDGNDFELLINWLLVRAGYAKVFTGEVSKSVRYRELMTEAEDAAEAEGRGLWSAATCNGG